MSTVNHPEAIREAAISLFISDGGVEVNRLIQFDKSDSRYDTWGATQLVNFLIDRIEQELLR